VLTLDIEMPQMDGLTFLRKLMSNRPMPVIIVSSQGQSSCRAAMEAFRLGAVDVIAKPGGPFSVETLGHTLAEKVRSAASARVAGAARRAASGQASDAALSMQTFAKQMDNHFDRTKILAIGASTGGTEAIYEILRSLPPGIPPTLIVQHIPAGFSRAFAARLNDNCHISVSEAADGDRLRPGHALLAPGNFHMILRRVGAEYYVAVKDGPLVCYQRPSVDVLFRSVAALSGSNSVGVILTGMGTDGAEGLLEMRRKGAVTIAQNEESCVVFGMHREAVRLGAASAVLPLDRIAGAIVNSLSASVSCQPVA